VSLLLVVAAGVAGSSQQRHGSGGAVGSGSRGGELGLRRRADARCGVGSRVGSESHRESPGDAALLHRKKEIKDVGCGLCQAKKMVGRHLGLTGPKEEKRLA